jgi:hypothetical protein
MFFSRRTAGRETKLLKLHIVLKWSKLEEARNIFHHKSLQELLLRSSKAKQGPQQQGHYEV